jgi:hypothetical protein
VLDGVGDQRHAPATLPPEKTRYPLHRTLSKVRKGYVIIPTSPSKPSSLLYEWPGQHRRLCFIRTSYLGVPKTPTPVVWLSDGLLIGAHDVLCDVITEQIIDSA